MKAFLSSIALIFMASFTLSAAQLAIVIDDFGYRYANEKQIIQFSSDITIAVLPYSPNARTMAEMARSHGNEVIIHLPMAPLSQQPLEKNTLFPSMSAEQIEHIIDDAVARVPYAIGVNNHMGSLMTSSQDGMDKVMQGLAKHQLFFLDSRTIGNSKARTTAERYRIPVLSRDIFLDDTQSESTIAHQFELAVALAKRKGVAIVIGHPYPQTVNVLRSKLASLDKDVQLVKLSQLIVRTHKVTLGEILNNLNRTVDKLLVEPSEP